MDPPGGQFTAAGDICTHCPHGSIEVIVWQHAVCWDTPPDGEQAADPRFDGVRIRVNEFDTWTAQPDGSVRHGTRWLAEKTTGTDGKVVFTDLVISECVHTDYWLTACKPGYEDITSEVPPITVAGSQVELRRSVTVMREQTAHCDLVLRARQARFNDNATWDRGRECLRRHGRPPSPQYAPSGTLAGIFWKDQPMTLFALDLFWVLITPLAVLPAALFSPWVGMAALSVAALALAFFSYSGAVIFGEGFGFAAIAIAAAAFAALLVINIFMAAFHQNPDPYGMAVLAGVWAAFAFGYKIEGRKDEWRKNLSLFLWVPALYFWASAAIAAVAAGAIAAVLLAASGQSVGVIVLILTIFAGAWLGMWSGWAGFSFANEGKTETFGATDFQLPYLGERYCLQGARGFWSHYQAEEGSYDWSMPFGTDILCAKEGHIVAHSDSSEDVDNRDRANYVAVRHRDGSISRSAYFKTEPNTDAAMLYLDPKERAFLRLRNAVSSLVSTSGWRFSARSVAPSRSENPVHVCAGHWLGYSGWPRAPRQGGSGPAWWVLIVGAIFAFVTCFMVFLGAATKWYGEPGGPDPQIAIRLPGNWFEKLWNAADTAYSVAWAKAHPDFVNSDGSPVRERGCIDPADPASATLGSTKFDRKYCECLNVEGTVKQPGNVYSDFGFVILGLLILYLFSKSGPDYKPYSNRMTRECGYTLAFGLMIIFMGPGSMLFHISMNAFAGLGDGVSMYFFGGYLLAYNITRLADWGFLPFLAMWVGSALLACIANIAMVMDEKLADHTTLIMVVLVGPAVLILLGIVIWSRSMQSDAIGNWSLISSMACFFAAFTVWILSYTGADPPEGTTNNPLCNPDWAIFSPKSPIQGHALWHIVAAMGVFFLYFYFQREGNPLDPEFPRLHFTVSDAPAPGPGVDADAPLLRPGDRLAAEIGFKAVKFTDGSLSADGGRPWSMRKYLSANQYVGLPPLPAEVASFNPVGGQHQPASPYTGAGDYPAPGEFPGGAPPSDSPSVPGVPPNVPSTFPPAVPPSSAPPSVPPALPV